MRFGWFLTGVVATLSLQGAAALGAFYASPPPAPAEQVVTVERAMVFKVLAPKGMEEFGHIKFNCTPAVRESKIRSGKR